MFGEACPVLSSSSTSHDTVLCPYARLFDHFVGAGDPLWRWRDEGAPFSTTYTACSLTGLSIAPSLCMARSGSVTDSPSVQDLFRLAVHVQPEVTLDDLSHDHTRMVMAPGFETGGDLYCGIDDLQIGAGTSALCRIVRLIGEGWTGEGGCWAWSDSTMPHVMRAVQSTMRLNMFPSSQDGMYAKGATQGVPLACPRRPSRGRPPRAPRQRSPPPPAPPVQHQPMSCGTVSRLRMSVTMHLMGLHPMIVSSSQPRADLLLSMEAERWRSPAGSGSGTGADAVGNRCSAWLARIIHES